MYIASHEWQRPAPAAPTRMLEAAAVPAFAALYARLAAPSPDEATRAVARDFLAREVELGRDEACDLPEHPQDLAAWLHANAQAVHAKYALYLQARKDGGPRQFFRNRAHALHFLRCVAPTKLVDGAWLYGTLAQWRNPLMVDLVRTYVEELGEGDVDKNHVVLYRRLLDRFGLDPLDDLPDGLYRQGAIQLALGCNAQAFLPEIVGFNLGYEQLPLHLLITSYELNELGIDPYYFTLHVTVDNGDTGHARRACDAVMNLMPRLDDGGEFWRRVRAGSQLANAGLGTSEVIAQFDIEREVERILAHKAPAGSGAHSDYCRVAGRSINEWLRDPQAMPQFIAALESAGWIRRNQPPVDSRFWKLLQGPRAEMFGVFSPYELQVIHDWIRGDASVDGAPFDQVPPDGESRRQPTFRATVRKEQALGLEIVASGEGTPPDADQLVLRERLTALPAQQRDELLVSLMAPAHHWSPVGLEATRVFWQSASRG